ncbi:MAG TPA: SDR family NAD(P)-dependent oxidoreductase [Polyangiaceae bacterium]
MSQPVCVVVGVGPGNGAAFARRFAAGGYAVALLARGYERTEALAKQLPGARAYSCDVADPARIKDTFAALTSDLGVPQVVIYNAGSGVWGTMEQVTPEQLLDALRVNTTGLLACAQQVAPGMRSAGKGSIVVVGATASRRGGAKTAGFAPAKAAQKSLAESMARHLGPQGIHVSLIVIDGVVDLPATRERMTDKPDSFFVKPFDVAETAWWLSHQPRSAWSFEVDVRPFAETW